MLTLEKFVDIIFKSKGWTPLVEVCQEGAEMVEEQFGELLNKFLIDKQYRQTKIYYPLTQTHRELRVAKKIELALSNTTFAINAEISSIGGTPRHDVKVKVVLFDSRYKFSVEHEVLVLSVTDVEEDEISDAVEHMLSDLPEVLAHLIYDF